MWRSGLEWELENMVSCTYYIDIISNHQETTICQHKMVTFVTTFLKGTHISGCINV